MIGFISAVLLFGGGNNASFTVAAVLAIPILLWLTFRPQESPVLLFVMLYQWLQITTKSFHASFLGMDVRDMLPYAPVDVALWLGLFGLLSLAAGLKLATFNMNSRLSERAQAQAMRLPLLEMFKLHIGMLIGVDLLIRFAAFGGLSQAILAIGYLRYVTLFIIAYAVVVKERGFMLMLLLLLAEIAYSFGGFFAGFRLPLFVTLLAVGSVPIGRSIKRPIVLVVLAIATLYVGVLWQSVKSEYRDFVSQDSGEQVVLVDRNEQIEKLTALIGDVNTEVLERGTEALAVRFAYVDMFAFAIGQVPGAQPHTDGELLGNAVAHVLMPRAFFPNKAIIDDTEFTKKYTGLAMHSIQGTSISLGYIAETYIDFGVPGMFFATFGIGIFFGLCYRWISTYRVINPVLRVALVTMLFLAMGDFSVPMSKVFGGFLVPFFVAAMLVIFGEERISRMFARHFGLNFATRGDDASTVRNGETLPP